jgi:hypothetical protein
MDRERGGGGVKIASILEVLHAINSVAPGHPAVTSWWYAPPRRLGAAGQRARSDDGRAPIEVVVGGEGLDASRLPPIAADLSRALGGAPATARLHRGAGEETSLFRMLSARGALPAQTAARA